MGLDAPAEIILFLGSYANKTSTWLLQKGIAIILIIYFFFLRSGALHSRCYGKHPWGTCREGPPRWSFCHSRVPSYTPLHPTPSDPVIPHCLESPLLLPYSFSLSHPLLLPSLPPSPPPAPPPPSFWFSLWKLHLKTPTHKIKLTKNKL